MTQTEHISKQFDADLERLRASVLQMGGLVEQQIEHALQSLLHWVHQLQRTTAELLQ